MTDLHRLELVDDGPQGTKAWKLALDGFELKGVVDYHLYGPIDEPWKELVITLHVESVNAPEQTDKAYPERKPVVGTLKVG